MRQPSMSQTAAGKNFALIARLRISVKLDLHVLHAAALHTPSTLGELS